MDPYRLPTTVVPTRYDLRLEPDLATFTFTGVETVAVTVRAATAEIVLNAAELSVDRADIDGVGAATVVMEEETERCRLTFPAPLAPGDYRLRLAFRGTLNDKLRGFYRSTYKDAAGATRPLAATQFEATDARRCFPCWDEPAFKAVFACTLAIDPNLTAVSNAAVVEERREGDKKVLRFADTVPMSTYLVAFVVGDLEATEPVLAGKTPLRVWCVPGKKHLAPLALDIGAFSLKLFADYYGQPYPGDKLDLIAVPDFAAGAMENLGAITFRETALLVDEATATRAERERVADIVAHENAHMWFGDLVTMQWWNGLWLNEAFATFVEMVAVDAWKPEWQRWTTFAVSSAAAFVVDGLHATRPVEYPVASPRDADAMFDVLTYEKGASVLRMLEQYLGAEVFRAGVRLYLERHKFANAETTDLWQALADASKQPIPEIMDGWVFRAGYPLVSARLDGGDLVLSQRRFTYLSEPPDGIATTDAGTRWQIPIRVRVGREIQRLLLTSDEARLKLSPDARAIVVNEGGHGFYRVRYKAELLRHLLDHVADLLPIERFQLVNDAWAAVLAGLTPLTDYLDLTARFRGEGDKNVWSALLASFHALGRIVAEEDRPRLEALVRDRVGPAASALGWEARPNDDELTRQLRGELLKALGTLGDDRETQARAAAVFGSSTADADVRAAAIAILGHTGDAARYDDFLTRFRSAKTPQEEQRFLHALAAFRAPEFVARTLTLTLDGTVRTQDAPLLLRALFAAPHSRGATWEFVRANWDVMARTYPLTGLRRLFEGVTALARPEWEQQVVAFVAMKKIDFGGKTLRQFLEQLRVAVALGEREGNNLRAYLWASFKSDGAR